MVEIQLETYTADSISAHRKIRQDSLCSSDSLFCPVIPMLFISFHSTLWLILVSKQSFAVVSCFREKLDSELKACWGEKQSVELKLASFEILGKEFEVLAEEYCRLRQEIEMKNWALKEFTQYNDK